ncbi:MAG: hypothetical protein AB7O24_16490 [Kofleriaceae bacterium]
MRRRTTRCRDAHHPELDLEVGTADPQLTDRLFDWIETTVRSGTTFELGETVRFCSAMFQVRGRSDKTLALYEPKPGSMPVVWIDSVEDSLRTVERQREVVASVGLAEDLDFPDPLRLTYFCTRVARGARVTFARGEPQAKDSGWIAICCQPGHDHDNPDEVECVTIHELGTVIPEFRLIQALPIGSAVRLGGGKPVELAFDRKLRAIPDSSLLQSLGCDSRPAFERGW